MVVDAGRGALRKLIRLRRQRLELGPIAGHTETADGRSLLSSRNTRHGSASDRLLPSPSKTPVFLPISAIPNRLGHPRTAPAVRQTVR
jgi:hypothetical protein